MKVITHKIDNREVNACKECGDDDALMDFCDDVGLHFGNYQGVSHGEHQGICDLCCTTRDGE